MTSFSHPYFEEHEINFQSCLLLVADLLEESLAQKQLDTVLGSSLNHHLWGPTNCCQIGCGCPVMVGENNSYDQYAGPKPRLCPLWESCMLWTYTNHGPFKNNGQDPKCPNVCTSPTPNFGQFFLSRGSHPGAFPAALEGPLHFYPSWLFLGPKTNMQKYYSAAKYTIYKTKNKSVCITCSWNLFF